jgi:outer membrane protein OmpA-like peptidoglycan-associated protein
LRPDPVRIKVTKMRAAGLCLFLASCATTAAAPDPRPNGEAQEGEGEIELMTVVAEKCSIPELKAFFHFGTAEIKSGQANLDQLATCLVSGPLRDEKLLLVGHTDPTGPDEYNDQLALFRAKSVGDYLIQHGVAKERIAYQSLGKQDAAPDPKKHASDRRVDIRLWQ